MEQAEAERFLDAARGKGGGNRQSLARIGENPNGRKRGDLETNWRKKIVNLS